MTCRSDQFFVFLGSKGKDRKGKRKENRHGRKRREVMMGREREEIGMGRDKKDGRKEEWYRGKG